jgi:hypothetical protein
VIDTVRGKHGTVRTCESLSLLRFVLDCGRNLRLHGAKFHPPMPLTRSLRGPKLAMSDPGVAYLYRHPEGEVPVCLFGLRRFPGDTPHLRNLLSKGFPNRQSFEREFKRLLEKLVWRRPHCGQNLVSWQNVRFT